MSHLGLPVLSTIHGMSAIWDVRYWEVSLYKETDSRVIQPPASNFFYNSFEWCFIFFTYFSEQNKEFYSLIVKLKTLAIILPLAMLNYEPYVKPSVTLYLSMLLIYKKNNPLIYLDKMTEKTPTAKCLSYCRYKWLTCSLTKNDTPPLLFRFCYCKSMRRYLLIS